jgi:alanine-glyoxylate transaminase/serine-glyoxylate transaminase/serine-pyruvate transaminase
MIPGPAALDDDVIDALHRPIAAHYGPEWVALWNKTIDLARRTFQTAGSAFVLFSSGTGGMEAAIANLTAPGERVLIANNGYFGYRLEALARSRGLHPVLVKAPWGVPIDPADVRAILAENRDITTLIAVHHETSTGILNPIAEIGTVAREFGTTFIVDAIASLAGEELTMDAWGIDACVGVGNKALGAPVGLAMVGTGPRFWEIADRKQPLNPAPGWYLNLRTWRQYIEEWGDWHPSPVTMSSHNLEALCVALEKLHREGLPQRLAQVRQVAADFRAGLRQRGLVPYVDGPTAASVITAVNRPITMEVAHFTAWLAAERGIMIAGGLGETRGHIFRVGHMGPAASAEYSNAFFAALDDYLA